MPPLGATRGLRDGSVQAALAGADELDYDAAQPPAVGRARWGARWRRGSVARARQLGVGRPDLDNSFGASRRSVEDLDLLVDLPPADVAKLKDAGVCVPRD
jgi:hypothetical protein